MQNDHRETLFKLLDPLYAYFGDVGDPCTYCGVPSTGWDHVPPLHFIDRLTADERVNFNLRCVPACGQCNSWLGGVLKFTIPERRAIVRDKMERKYSHVLRIPEWDEADLSQLSPTLQNDIRAKLRFASFIRERMSFYAHHRHFDN